MMRRGHERWHPSPEFYYKAGGGPLFDMGPYYITNLIQLLGPMESVSAYARISRKQRTITSEPLYGQVIDVEVPTHVAGNFQFKSGAIGTMIMSFDVPSHILQGTQNLQRSRSRLASLSRRPPLSDCSRSHSYNLGSV